MNAIRKMVKKLFLPILAILILLGQGTAHCQAVHLTFYDRNGIQMTGTTARLTMTASGKGWNNDALVNPNTLQQLVDLPLVNSADGMSFTLPNEPVALAVNWPTVRGYSLVILDNNGLGFTTETSINFTYQAAHDALHHLDLALIARPIYQRSRYFDALYESAVDYLIVADQTTDESIKGKNGQLALDNIAQAMDILLTEYGSLFIYNRSLWIGFTIDNVSHFQTKLVLAQTIGKSNTWIRIVFAPHQSPSHYSDIIKKAHKMGIKIMGLPVDSTYDKQYTDDSYERWIEQLVIKFPEVDAWEIGNEVNGNWLSTTIPTRVARAAAYVKANSAAKVVLTLYWEMGTGYARHSTFNWARENLTQSTRDNIDVVLLSMYVENAPMGLAFDQIMRQLQQEFPNQQIGLGELGYWESDTAKAWWAMDQINIMNARKLIVAQYYTGVLAFQTSIGGGFWWGFPDTFPSEINIR